MKVSALIHLLNWYSEKKIINLLDGVRLIHLEGTQIEKLYQKECIENGLDDSEPYIYHAAIEIDLDINDFSGDSFYDPFSLGSQILNILAIQCESALGMVRVIFTTDNYKTLQYTNIFDHYTAQNDFIRDITGIGDIDFNIMQKMSENLIAVWENERGNSRLVNALTYFYHSWHIHYLEQTAVNLAICLECLFSPSSNSELSHQISFNIASFITDNPMEKEKLYREFKKFYSTRSKLVHGEIIKDKDLKIITTTFFKTTKILRKILFDPELAQTFNDNNKRKKYLNELVFK